MKQEEQDKEEESKRLIQNFYDELNQIKNEYREFDTRQTFPLFTSTTIYGGEWKSGFKDGKGRQEWANQVYVGDWEYDDQSGWGKLTHAEGYNYEGEWENNEANGKGTSVEMNGSYTYEGDVKNRPIQNSGKMISIMEKEFKFGLMAQNMKESIGKVKKLGRGTLNFADGSKYEGQFLQNDINGYGTCVWPNKSVYKGEWKQNKMNGKGCLKYEDGRKYTGEYEEDKRHGKGIYDWADGRKYIGTWFQGRQHGIGIYYQQNKEIKVGEWKEGKRVKWFEQAQINQLVSEGKINKMYLQLYS